MGPSHIVLAQERRADATLAEAQTSQAVLNFWLEWDWAAAEAAARRAATLNPAYAFARHVLANVLSHSGRHAEALEEIRRARELEPLDPMLYAMVAARTVKLPIPWSKRR